MIKDLVNPSNFNLMVSKVGEESGLCGQCIWRQHAAVWNLELPRAQDMTSKDLV
jgi:hypothetical protein